MPVEPLCSSCQRPLPAVASFCPACGEPLRKRPSGRRAGHFWHRLQSALDVRVALPLGPRVARRSGRAAMMQAVLEAAADPKSVETNPLTLRFASDVLESAFEEQYHRESLRHIRFAVIMGIVLVAAFGVLDVLIQPTVFRQLWVIRYAIICPYAALALALTFVPRARRHLEWIVGSALVVTAAGIVAMILIAPPPGRDFYYAGLILATMYSFTLLKLRFAIASAVGWSFVLMYLGAEVALGEAPWVVLANNLFFFVSATVIGMFAAYFLEALARRNFVQENLVRRAREFGSYRLVARLGRGGMGEVWRAHHELLARPAALKLIRPEVLGVLDRHSEERVLARFEREAQATAQLQSPHTIQLYDYGVTDDGTFYYVMELLDGFDFETLVGRFGAMPVERAVSLLTQACDSLGEAHQRGLIHRDIKPANIYVCRYGRAADFVKVLDFGLVKTRDESRRGDDEWASGVGLAGTPSCMAPEQITGDRPVDWRTDIYALGCVAYWLVTGREVFDVVSVDEMLRHHVGTVPRPPSARARQPIPPPVDAAILACLEKDPARRPQAADDFAGKLNQAVDRGSWSDADAERWWARHAPSLETPVAVDEERLVMPSLLRAR